VTAPTLPADWVPTNAQGAAPLWVSSATLPDTAPNDAFVDDPAGISDKDRDTPGIAITSPEAQVSFRNNYNTESTFDGDVLEVSSPTLPDPILARRFERPSHSSSSRREECCNSCIYITF